ncbi:MAG TPA: L,D-transpeptidase family protein [Gaiellaceae bacterium]|nr:L,D-transpeptidase family protein [Gaiellaceae bacterium]
MKRTGLILIAATTVAFLAAAAHAEGPGRRAAAPTALPAGVTIAGVPVGGLPPAQAYAAVRAAFEVPVSLVVGERLVLVDPATLGAVGYAKRAVWAAAAARPGAKLKLQVAVRAGTLRHYIRGLAAGIDRKAVDAQLTLRSLRPSIRADHPGIRLERVALARAITAAFLAGSREPIFVSTAEVQPNVTVKTLSGPVIVIHRGHNRLELFDGERLVRTFPVATGQAVYPTPLGRFSIVVRWKNPWWYPPTNDAWAAGLKPTPPGPGNPLGTRWMGLSAPGVGIHGTNEDSSIGYSESHGCIRMHVPDSEWLFDHVEVGTPVFIVAD